MSSIDQQQHMLDGADHSISQSQYRFLLAEDFYKLTDAERATIESYIGLDEKDVRIMAERTGRNADDLVKNQLELRKRYNDFQYLLEDDSDLDVIDVDTPEGLQKRISMMKQRIQKTWSESERQRRLVTPEQTPWKIPKISTTSDLQIDVDQGD